MKTELNGVVITVEEAENCIKRMKPYPYDTEVYFIHKDGVITMHHSRIED